MIGLSHFTAQAVVVKKQESNRTLSEREEKQVKRPLVSTLEVAKERKNVSTFSNWPYRNSASGSGVLAISAFSNGQFNQGGNKQS